MKGRTVIAAASIAAAAFVAGASVAAAPTDIASAASAELRAVRGEAFQVGESPEPPPPPEPTTANYRVTLNVVWSAATHPTTLPPNSHISPTVVATHGEVSDMFASGTLASPGIERMAESGSTGTLRGELDADSTVTSVDTGGSIFGAGTDTFDVTLTQDASLVSLVTMLAPSPDWFVGLDSVSMFIDGKWADTFQGDLGVYDAGTDSAATFVHSNNDTSPADIISGPRDPQFAAAAAEGRFGFVTITRLP